MSRRLSALLSSLQTALRQGRLQRLHCWAQTCASRWHYLRLHHPVAGHCLSYGSACLLGLSASGLGGWLWILQPAQATLQQSRVDVSLLKKAYEIKLGNAPSDALERVQQSRRLLAQRESMLSDHGEQLATMHEIDALGRAHQLRFTLFKPEPSPTGDTPDSMIFSVRGTFENIVRFTAGIAHLPRIVILDRLQLQILDDGELATADAAQAGSPQLVLRAVANTYPHSLALATAATAAKSTAGSRDTSATEASATEETGYGDAD